MSPTWGIEAITSPISIHISIHLHLNKISGYQQMRTAYLSSNHVIKSLLEHHHITNLILHCLFLEKLTSKQRLKVKSFIVDTNNYLNGILPSFNPLHKELSPSFWLVDIFSNYFSFNTINHKSNDTKSSYLCKLDKIFENSSQNIKNIVVISDASLKNNVTIFTAHVCLEPNVIAKTIHHMLSMSHQLRLNCLQLDMELIK